MALEFSYPDKERQMNNMHELVERTYVNHAQDKVVDAATHKGGCLLLGGKGHRIPMSQAIALGLVEGEKEEKAEKPAPEKKEKKGEKEEKAEKK